MPRPTAATTLQRPDLGMLAYEYNATASQRGFIGTMAMPAFFVPEQTADYPVIPIEALLKLPDTKRAPRANYNRGDYEFETDTYACIENGWEEPLDDVERRLYARLFDAEMVAVQRAIDIILRVQEKRISALLFNTGNFSSTGVTTEWSTITATPYADVIAGKQSMRANGGLEPNTLIMSKKVLENLLKVTEVRESLQYSADKQIEFLGINAQAQMLARYFGVDRLLVGDAIYDSAKKKQSFSISDIWDDEYVMLAKVSNAPDILDPSVGRTFVWEEDAPGMLVTEQYREEQKRSWIYRTRQHTDEEIIFSNAGYLLSNITA
jgi:hypothetical protein